MSKEMEDEIPDWAKIKSYREAYPKTGRGNEAIVVKWEILVHGNKALESLAKRIAKTDAPPVPQELLIWREAWARLYDEYNNTNIAKSYRSGMYDRSFHEDSVIYQSIKLALEGYGKDGYV